MSQKTFYQTYQTVNCNHNGIVLESNCKVNDNTVVGSSIYGIMVLEAASTIEENLVTESAGCGIYFGVEAATNYWAHNRLLLNAAGVCGSVPAGSLNGGGNVDVPGLP